MGVKSREGRNAIAGRPQDEVSEATPAAQVRRDFIRFGMNTAVNLDPRWRSPTRTLSALLIAGVLVVPGMLIARSAHAYVTWYGSLAGWQEATDDDVVAVTFSEPLWPLNQALAGTWTTGGIAITGLAGTPFPNIWVSTAPSPMGMGNWMVSNGDENIDIVPLASPTALALNAASNQFGPATIRVFDTSDNEIGLLQIPIATNRFVGIVSVVPIGKLNFSSVQGAVTDTGFDTIRLADRSLLVGDLDGDGDVDGADLGLLVADWGGFGPADLDCDGIVGGGDLGLLIAAWTG